MRFLWMGLVGVALAGVVSAEPPVVKKTKKIGNNHNSYIYHDNRPRSRAPRPAPAPQAQYAEIDVQDPTLQAVPLTPVAPAVPVAPAPQVMATESYTQQHNPGPSQLAANRSGTFSSSIYTTGPIWGPRGFGNGFYNGFPYGPGFYNTGFNNGFYPGCNPGFPNGAFLNPCNTVNGAFFNSGCNVNLTQQRLNLGPGEHPFSIQMPRAR